MTYFEINKKKIFFNTIIYLELIPDAVEEVSA